MSGIIPIFGATGISGNYQMIRSRSSGQIWNGTAMESWNQSHWTSYVVSSPEQAGSGCYVAGVPGALPPDIYQAVLYTPLGGSPASGDTPIGTKDFSWDGSNIIYAGSGVNVTKINGVAAAAANLAVAAGDMVVGQTQAGVLTGSQMTTNLTNTLANAYAGRIVIFTAGVNAGRAALITAYVVAGGLITMIGYNNQVLLPPNPGDSFIVK